MAIKRRHQYLMSGLLQGWDWFDNGLQNVLKGAGFRSLNKSQSMMVLYISAGVHRPIEIARRMRLSRQAIRHIETQLVALKMITARPDPNDRRSKMLMFTTTSTRVRQFARRTILDLERELERRIGARSFRAMRTVLDLDWGGVVSGMPRHKANKRR